MRKGTASNGRLPQVMAILSWRQIWVILSIIIFTTCRESAPVHGFEVFLRADQTIDFQDFDGIGISDFIEVFREFIEEKKEVNKTITIDFGAEDETKIGFVKEVKEILKGYRDFIILTIHPIKGDPIYVKLPPQTNEKPDLSMLRKRNTLVLFLSAENKIYQDTIDQQNEITSEIKFLVKEFLKSDTTNVNLPVLTIRNLPEIGNVYCAERSIVVIKSEYDTRFYFYNNIYHQVMSAYHEVWEENSLYYFKESYDKLPTNRKKIIKTMHPYVVAEID